MPATDVITVALSPPQTLQLLAKLEALLPYTIPLTRRTQCHVRESKETSFVILSIPSTKPINNAAASDTQTPLDSWLSSPSTPPPNPYLAAFIDLSTPGSTQSWLFGSWELPHTTSPPARHQNLVNSLFTYVHSVLVPQMPLEPPASWLWLRDNKKWVSQPFSRSKVLIGTLHEGVRKLIPDEAVARVDARYGKYIFPRGRYDGDTVGEGKGLAEGYVFGTLGEAELQKVLDGSPIPRTLGYLKEVVNAGVYHQSKGGERELVAYAFLGKDGSLGGLDVATAHRGKGLAGALGAELFRRQAKTFSYSTDDESSTEDKEGWFYHADVGEDNMASRRAMEKLGGKVMWTVCWVEVDLDVVVGTK